MSPPTRPPPRNNRGSSRAAAGGAGAFRRARAADVGCGHGASTLLLADAYPSSEIVGFDAHDGSIQALRWPGRTAHTVEQKRGVH